MHLTRSPGLSVHCSGLGISNYLTSWGVFEALFLVNAAYSFGRSNLSLQNTQIRQDCFPLID